MNLVGENLFTGIFIVSIITFWLIQYDHNIITYYTVVVFYLYNMIFIVISIQNIRK